MDNETEEFDQGSLLEGEEKKDNDKKIKTHEVKPLSQPGKVPNQYRRTPINRYPRPYEPDPEPSTEEPPK